MLHKLHVERSIKSRILAFQMDHMHYNDSSKRLRTTGVISVGNIGMSNANYLVQRNVEYTEANIDFRLLRVLHSVEHCPVIHPVFELVFA